jgi:hypothetical protein
VITDARRLADVENATTRFPDTELVKYIESGVAEWWDMLIASRAWPWIGKTYITFSATTQSGSGPAVTFGGTPVSQCNVFVKIDVGGARGVATFSWSLNNGTDYEATGVPTAASVTLGNTGITASFAAGTYVLNETYSASTSFLLTKANKNLYELPDDFYKLQSVIVQGPGWASGLELDEVQKNEEAAYYMDTASYNSIAAYQLRQGENGSTFIVLLPTPSANTKIVINYFPIAPILSTSTDRFDDYNVWGADYASRYAARQCALKDENFEVADRLTVELNGINKRIQTATAGGRTATAPHIQNKNNRTWQRRGFWY